MYIRIRLTASRRPNFVVMSLYHHAFFPFGLTFCRAVVGDIAKVRNFSDHLYWSASLSKIKHQLVKKKNYAFVT